jgi:succinoglycan biosynthesis protein ExoM
MIGLCTYKRPEMLKNALDGISKLILPKEFSGIIIVDNNPKGSALNTINSFKQSFNYPIYSFIETNKGIVYARQRVLNEAHNIEANILAFFDDDAIPDPNWLTNLYSFYINHNCIVATGDQIQILQENAPKWIKNGGFFKRNKSRPEAKELKGAATNNVLFSLDFVKDKNLSFDVSFNTTGGSDTDFFWQFYKNGAKILWTNTAIVREEVPDSRANFKWLFNRSLAMGTRKYLHIVKEKKMPYIFFVTQTLFKFTFGSILILLVLPFGKIKLYKTIFQWARSVGVLKSILGSKHQEYLKEHHGN